MLRAVDVAVELALQWPMLAKQPLCIPESKRIRHSSGCRTWITEACLLSCGHAAQTQWMLEQRECTSVLFSAFPNATYEKLKMSVSPGCLKSGAATSVVNLAQ